MRSAADRLRKVLVLTSAALRPRGSQARRPLGGERDALPRGVGLVDRALDAQVGEVFPTASVRGVSERAQIRFVQFS